MKIALTLSIIVISIFVLSITPAFADPLFPEEIFVECGGNAGPVWLENIGVECGHLIPAGCTDSNPGTICGLNEAFQTIINFTQILLALTGSVMILMFVYGGTMMIIGGAMKEEYITKGKDAIKAAVIGLIIILGAWLAINFTILALTQGEVGGAATIFGEPFSEAPTGGEPSEAPTTGGEPEEKVCQSGIKIPPDTGLCDSLCGGTQGPLMSDGQACCICP